jgi:sterol desaturase/sphingolipid hydroxylase (fatty acid hydroxylase superfamily)
MFATTTIPVEYLSHTKAAVTVGVLAVLWVWETSLPFFERREARLRHAGRNLAVALLNTVVLAAAFSTGSTFVAAWAQEQGFGLLHVLDLGSPVRLVLALVLLDGWMYLWHRANHTIPVLWRFHRMHHSETEMDVTTATRFHLGEHIGASLLRVGLIPVLGFEVCQLIVYDTVLIAVTMLHHANVSLGRSDRWLRWLIVTPDMHKVHHSSWRNRLQLLHGVLGMGPAGPNLPNACRPENAAIRPAGVPRSRLANRVGDVENAIRQSNPESRPATL